MFINIWDFLLIPNLRGLLLLFLASKRHILHHRVVFPLTTRHNLPLYIPYVGFSGHNIELRGWLTHCSPARAPICQLVLGSCQAFAATVTAMGRQFTLHDRQSHIPLSVVHLPRTRTLGDGLLGAFFSYCTLSNHLEIVLDGIL